MGLDATAEKEQAVIAYSGKNYSDAITHYEKAIELGENDPSMLAQLAMSYFLVKRYDDAENAAKKAISGAGMFKKPPMLAYGALIDCLIVKKNFNSVITYSNKTIDIAATLSDKSFGFAYRGLGYFSLAQYDLAMADFNEALRLNAYNALALEFRASIYYREKKYAEALKDLQNLKKQAPNNPFANSRIPELEKLLGMASTAAGGGGDSRLYFLKGREFEKKSDFINALENYRKAYELDSNNVGIYQGLSYASYRLADYAYAKKYLDEAIGKGLTSAYIYNSYGLILSAEKDYAGSLQYFDKAIAGNQKITSFYANRAIAYFFLNKYDEATSDIKEALKLDENNYFALLYMAKIDAAQGKKDDAVALVKQILEKYPKDPAANTMLTDLMGIRLTEEDARRGLTGFELPTVPKETFANVAGMDALKEHLKEAIIYPLLNPELAREYGISAGGGILLYGPPGCGKTFMMKATAGEAKVNFINAKLTELMDMWIGNSEKNIHNLFELARKNAPCILFFDEIDALGGKREMSTFNVTSRQVVNTMLTELDGAAADNKNILVVGATNAPWIVDNAIKRPGRLGNLIYVPAPDKASRESLFRLYLSGKPVDADIDYSKLAALTNLCNCADIADICKDAAKIPWSEAIRTGKKRSISQADIVKVVSEHKKSLPEWYDGARGTVQAGAAEGMYKELFDALSSYEKTKDSGSANYYA